MQLEKVFYNSVPYPNLTVAAYIICIYFIKRRISSDIISIENYRQQQEPDRQTSFLIKVQSISPGSRRQV